jgi:putative hemolysin
MNSTLESGQRLVSLPAQYETRRARDAAEVRAAQELRFQVFNLELNEGLQDSYLTGRDEDPFDAVCDHLIVEHQPTKAVIGTYRLQTGEKAARRPGSCCEQEFDFAVFEPLRAEVVELGRACVLQQHRNLVVLAMLWKGIAQYARERGARYLVGCSSLTSQDATVGASACAELCRRHLASPNWRMVPLPEYECPLHTLAHETPKIPKLLRANLSLGAQICGPPALDPHFKTIDFLTLMDLTAMPEAARMRWRATRCMA